MLRQHNLLLRLLAMISVISFAVALVAVPTGTFAAKKDVKVVASGLDNPRGLAFGADGALYVAEAGRGGDTCVTPIPEEPEFELCYGTTGAITRITRRTQEEFTTGLVSFAEPDGSFAIGPHDVSLLANGQAYVVVGLGPPRPTEARAVFGDLGANFGQLVRVEPNGEWQNVADLATYEEANDPDGLGPDSNPYALLALSGRRVVVDAAGNSLLQVDPDGNISTLAVFPERLVPAPPGIPDLPPEIPMNSVPTSVAVGPDGAYYVGELTGFPFPVGEARVYRVVPGEEPEIYAEGFTNIIDIAFAADGSLYVLEIAKNGLLQAEGPEGDFTGALIRVAPDGTRTELAAGQLTAPTGLAIGPDRRLYVSNYGVFPEQGQVVQIKACKKHDKHCTPLAAPLVATLTGEAEVDDQGNPGQGDPDGSGSATVTLNANAGKVCFQIAVADIAQPTQAHIHRGAAGTNGPVVVDFTPYISGNIVSGCVEADRDLIENIQANPSEYYVNVHNDDYPAGAVRGQLVRGDTGDEDSD